MSEWRNWETLQQQKKLCESVTKFETLTSRAGSTPASLTTSFGTLTYKSVKEIAAVVYAT